MKAKLLLCFSLLFLSTVSRSQTWEKNFTYPVSPVYAYSVIDFEFDTLEGGLIIGGHNLTASQSYFVRMNRYGDTLWTKFNDSSYLQRYYPDALTRLSNGNYLIGGSRIDSVNNYHLHEIDLNGATISDTSFPIEQTFFGGNGKLKTGYFNDYFLKYQNDSMVATSTYMSKHFIEKRDNSGTVLWQISRSEPTLTGVVVIYNIYPTPDGGVIYTFENNSINPGKIELIKLDALGNEIWNVDARTLVAGSSSMEGLTMDIFLANDSTVIADFSIGNFTGSNQRSFILSFDNLTGTLLDSTSVYNKIRIDKGTLTSNNQLLFSFFKYNSATSTVTDQGYMTFDTDLNFTNIHHIPLNPGYVLPKIIPNNMGGAFVSYNAWGWGYQAENFDSLFVTYPSEISGSIYVDNNHDCITNSGDVGIGGSIVALTDSSGAVSYSCAMYGNYSFHVPYGNYTVEHFAQPNKDIECPSPSVYSFNISSDSIISNANFYDTLVSTLNDVEVGIGPGCFVPGFNSSIQTYCYNSGAITTTTTLQFIMDDSTQFISAVPAPASISGDTLFFTVGPLYYDSIAIIDIELYTPPTVPLGTIMTFIAGVNPPGDMFPGNNADTVQSTVVGSFDPNDKAVNQPYIFNGTDEMIYKVRFQNTGTFYATNVVVIDTIDTDLDLSTFKLLSNSHDPINVQFGAGNKITFSFMSIHLPDSTSNEPGSHGEFVYSIKPKAGLASGTQIRNKAHIYFDFNAAVITNTTVNIVGTPGVGINEITDRKNDLLLFPNPAGNYLNVIISGEFKNCKIQCSDIAGRIVLNEEINSSKKEMSIDVSGLNAGIYILKADTGDKQMMKKFVISR